MNLGIFFETTADGDSVWWQSLASGLTWTLSTALFAGLIAFFLGSVLGVARTTSRPWLVRLGNAYVELFRNIPLIVQFFLWYFVVPGIIPAVKRWVTGLDPTEHQFVTAVVCLGLFTASRISEQVRSGIQSLPRGQR
ncbi:MAG TPA: ABC transporter permease subunit, partial [Burkholderiaceae bacterium]|nr:ABC transporter permease subunit [Burkholderiaceae bacterium]